MLIEPDLPQVKNRPGDRSKNPLWENWRRSTGGRKKQGVDDEQPRFCRLPPLVARSRLL
jgi:hypothetical protein